MKTSLIYPPNTLKSYGDNRVCFLAGPIQSAPNWQEEAVEIISRGVQEDLIIASPRNIGEWHGDYDAQVNWETMHLQRAATRGVILFWLAAPIEEHPTRCYGQTSRFELGEWLSRCRSGGIRTTNLIVGIEKGFSNERYIRHRVNEMFGGVLPVYESLEETSHAAVEALRNT